MSLQCVIQPSVSLLLLVLVLVLSLSGTLGQRTQPLYDIEQSDVIAPITTDRFSDYYKGKIGPAAWVCTDLVAATPEIAYDNIKSYFNGGNLESIQMSLSTWPVIEMNGTKNELCVYLESQYHCYPPTPNDENTIRGTNEHLHRHYYGRVFWGQASDNRVFYEVTELKRALAGAGITDDKVNYAIRYLAYFPNHVREVRFDALDPETTELPESSFTTDFTST